MSTYQFNYRNPTEVCFGVGRVKELTEIIKRFGNRALIIFGRNHAQESGLIERVETLCRQSSILNTTISGVEHNPTIEWVRETATKLKGTRFHVIVAIGGGSVMDAAKLISLALTHTGEIWEYRITGSLSVPGISQNMIPVITVPTTAGTGSEISPAAVITGDGKKEVYFSPHMFPSVAIIDPELAISMSREETAQTGMDAFVQGLEAFVSTNSQPFSDMYAEHAMRIVYRTLPSLLSDLNNVSHRTEMALASILSCYAIGQAGVGAIHALSDPLSARHNLPHGLAVSALLPSVMKANMAKEPSKFVKLARVLAEFDRDRDVAHTCDTGLQKVEQFLTKVNLSQIRLSTFGINSSEFSSFAKDSENPDMSTNPVKLSSDEIVSIYKSIL